MHSLSYSDDNMAHILEHYPKTENEGATEEGMLSAEEFNEFVDYVEHLPSDVQVAGQSVVDANTHVANIISGLHVKTINGQSVLGAGNINIEGGGDSYTAEISIDPSKLEVNVPEGTTNNTIDYTFTIKNKQGLPTGESVRVLYQITNGSGQSQSVTEIYTAGTQVSFNIDRYLAAGSNRIIISLEGTTTQTSTSASVIYNVIALELFTEFDITVPREKGEEFSFIVHANGAYTKYIETYLDGESITLPTDYITAARDGIITKVVDVPDDATVGVHTIQVRAYVLLGSTRFYSQTLYYEFAVKGEGVVTMLEATLTAGTLAETPLSIPAKQYEPIDIRFAIYDPQERTLAVTLSEGTNTIATRNVSNGEVASVSYTPLTYGNKTLTLTCADTTKTFVLDIGQSDVGFQKATEGLIFEVSAQGRSNDEANPAVWTSGDYSALFVGVPFNEKSGWNGGALVLADGASVSFPALKPLLNNVANTGLTIEIDYAVEAGAGEDEAEIIDLTNNDGHGILFTPTYVKVESNEGRNFVHMTMTGVKRKLAIIINRNVIDANKDIYMTMVDGMIGYSQNYTQATPFSSGNALTINSGTCKVSVYGIKVYNRALTMEEELGNAAVDSGNVVQIAANNDILDELGNISYEKTRLKCKTMKIIGDVQTLLAVQDKTTTITATVEYYDPDNIDNCWIAVGVTIKNQGTSTLKFPVKNFSFNFTNATFYDFFGNIKPMDGIRLRPNSAPVLKLVGKTDYMESSVSFNTAGAISFNDTAKNTPITIDGETIYPFRSNAQQQSIDNGSDTDIRIAIDGLPITMFYQWPANAVEVCMGQYCLNNGKDDCPEAYGFIGVEGYDNAHTERWEFAEEGGVCAFRPEADFDEQAPTYFECVFPDENHTNANLKRVVQWLQSLEVEGVLDVEGFEAGLGTEDNAGHTKYLDPWKLAHYYAHIVIKNIAVDQIAKNMHFITEDGYIWYPVYYDGDSAKLNDNDGYQFTDLFADRQSTDDQGNYYFQAHNSVLWNLVEASDVMMDYIRRTVNAEYSHDFNYAGEVATYITNHTATMPARIVNRNADFKYFDYYRKGSEENYLYVCQGTKAERVRLIADRRLKRYEAMWAFGGYLSRAINFRLITGNTVSAGHIKVTASNEFWFGYSSNLNFEDGNVGIHLLTGETHNFTVGTHDNGDILRVHGSDNMSEIDVSELQEGLYSFEVSNSYSAEQTSRLKRLYLSSDYNEEHDIYNAVVTQVQGLGVLTALEELDLRNYTAITAVEIGNLINLSTILLGGTSVAVFEPAAGSVIELADLPSTITDLTLVENDITTLNLTPSPTLNVVTMENLTGSFDSKQFVLDWIDSMTSEQKATKTLNLKVNWTGMTVEDVLALKTIGTNDIKGVLSINSTLTEQEVQQIIAAYGASAFDAQGALRIEAYEAVYLSADKDELTEGDSTQFTAVKIPPSESDAPVYSLVGGIDQTIGGVLYSVLGVSKINKANGRFTTSLGIGSDTTIHAQVNWGTLIARRGIVVHPLTYPTSYYIEGESVISSTGEHDYEAMPSDPFTAHVSSYTWTLLSSSIASIKSGTENQKVCTVVVENWEGEIPSVTLTCVVRFSNGTSRTATKTITFAICDLYVDILNVIPEAASLVATVICDGHTYNVEFGSHIKLNVGKEARIVFPDIPYTDFPHYTTPEDMVFTTTNGVVRKNGQYFSGTLRLNVRDNHDSYVLNALVDITWTYKGTTQIAQTKALTDGYDTFRFASGLSYSILVHKEGYSSAIVTGIADTSSDTKETTLFRIRTPFVMRNVTDNSISIRFRNPQYAPTLSFDYDIVDNWEEDTPNYTEFVRAGYDSYLSIPAHKDLVMKSDAMESWGKSIQADGHNSIYFDVVGGIEFAGNIMSLISGDEMPDYCFAALFTGCTGIVTAPELPATTLSRYCYYSMFNGCSNLVNAPMILPATRMYYECYFAMFSGCTSLLNAPIISATQLAQACFGQMFYRCSSLEDAPELPTTTLFIECYYMMFYQCTSLVNAPVLPALNLESSCYTQLFDGCTSLNYIKCLATNPSSSSCSNWVHNVASSGTFIKHPSATTWETGVSGIPANWTVEDAVI